MPLPHERPRRLRDLQEWLAGRIVDPLRLDAGPASDVLDDPPQGDLGIRLRVYADGYPARIRESLIESFPAVTHLIGERQTTELTARYLRSRPPLSFNLNHIGSQLAAFLRADPLTTSFPFLPDLATLEWHVMRAFHAAQLPPLDPTAFADWGNDDWETAGLRFQPAVAVVRSLWPLRDLHAAREIPVAQIDIDLVDRPENVLVRRHDLLVHCDAIDAREATALQALLSGATLGHVLAHLADCAGDPATVGAWFTRWMQLGLIVGVDPGTTDADPREGEAPAEP
jgi:hypothetical protein